MGDGLGEGRGSGLLCCKEGTNRFEPTDILRAWSSRVSSDRGPYMFNDIWLEARSSGDRCICDCECDRSRREDAEDGAGLACLIGEGGLG